MDIKIWKRNKNPLTELYFCSIATMILAGVMLGTTSTFCEKGGAMCIQATGMILLTVGALLALAIIELLFRGPFLVAKVYKNINSSNRRASIGGIAIFIISIIATIAMLIPIISRFV